MDSEALQRLVEQARNDPAFLHALVFKTESVLKDVDYLDRKSRAALVAVTPEEAIARLAGSGSSGVDGRRDTVVATDYAP
jgi:hypothetical protein